RQPQRESRIVWARRWIAARVVVRDDQRRGARCEARGHEHVWKRDRCARARAAREDVPGEEVVASGEARDREDLDGLAGEQWRQRGRGGWRITEHLRWQANRLTLIIAERAVRADELADAMPARGTDVCGR